MQDRTTDNKVVIVDGRRLLLIAGRHAGPIVVDATVRF
jgi:hypothetical protein